MRSLAGALVAIVALAGCGSAAAGDGSSGVNGLVVVGPTCPVEQVGSPCPDRPLSTDLEILRGSRVVATVHSGEDGRFRVALAPGPYTIGPKQTSGFPIGRPVQVTVKPHAFTSVTITFDSGIR